MAQILPFDIVSCSSEDSSFPVAELLHVDDITSLKGWQTAKKCRYPQELILRFEGEVDITQLQVLSHECKISSKVEVHVYSLELNNDDPSCPPSFKGLPFQKLGSFVFHNNEKSKSTSKERKTVHLQASAYFLKLVFRKNYPNQMNFHNQIGIYSIVVGGTTAFVVRNHADLPIGVPQVEQRLPPIKGAVSAPYFGAAPAQHPEVIPAQIGHPLQFVDPMNHSQEYQFRSRRILEFEKYYHNKMKDLTGMKMRAIEVEDFDIAKACKEQLLTLQDFAVQIYDLEAVKVRSIVDEDFDAAKSAKVEMDSLCQLAMGNDEPERKKTTVHPPPLAPSKKAEQPKVAHQNAGANRNQYEDQPVKSKYAQKMAEQATTKDAEEEHDDEETVDKRENVEEEQEPSEKAEEREQQATAAEEPEEAEEAEEEEEEEVEDDADGPSKMKPKKKPPTDTREKKKTTEEEPVENVTKSLTAFDLESFAEWERDIYFAIQDEASADKENPEPPADPLDGASDVVGLSEFNSVLGNYATACLFSRRWRLREAVVKVINKFSSHLFKHMPQTHVVNVLLKYADMKGYGLLDPILNVFLSMCDFVVRIIEGKFEECSLSQVQIHVSNLLPRLILRSGDPTQKSREDALALILCMAASSIGPERVMLATLADPVDHDKRRMSTQNHRITLARLLVMQQLLKQHQVQNRGSLTMDALMTKLVLPGLNHQHNEVREYAMAVVDCIDLGFYGQELYRYVDQIKNPAIRSTIEEKLGAPPPGREQPKAVKPKQKK